MVIKDLFEMSNFSSRTTGLPANLVVWCRTDLGNHGHNRYRIKVSKNGEWAGIFTVGQLPLLVKEVNSTLTASDKAEISKWIAEYSSLLIGLIDGKLDSGEFSIQLQKLRNG